MITSKILRYRGPTTNSDGKTTVSASQHATACNDWQRSNAHGRALRKMLEGWEEYAKAYHDTYDEDGDTEDQRALDYVIGPYWAEVGLAIHRLLDGETGGFDCGSLSGNILEAIEAEGMKSSDGHVLDEAKN